MDSTNKKKTRGTKRLITSSNKQLDKTIAVAFDEFIKEKEYQNKSKSTIRNYKQSYNFFVEYHNLGEDYPVKKITKEMVYQFIGSKKKEDVREASINHYLRDLRVFLYWCMEDSRKYIEPFKLQQIVSQEAYPKVINDEAIAALLEKPRGRADKDFVEWRSYAIVAWIAGTGNRAETVSEVRIGDLDFNKNEIILKHTKNNKAQSVPFSDATKTVIKEYILLYRNDAKAEDYLFCNYGNEKLTYNAMRLAHERYCKSREVENKSLHSLRHTFARNYVITGGGMAQLQRILGHANIATTKHYVDLFADDLKTDYEEHSLLDRVKKPTSRRRKIKSSEE